jgi:hypothetical protein
MTGFDDAIAGTNLRARGPNEKAAPFGTALFVGLTPGTGYSAAASALALL